MRQHTVARPLETYILLVADMFEAGVERTRPTVSETMVDCPSPWPTGQR